MFVGTPGHTAALLSQQIAGRLTQEKRMERAATKKTARPQL
jgi:hypothetical protein